MRRFLYIKTVLTAISIAVCSFTYSQPNSVKFNKIVHDFGDIMLNSGRHTCTFSFKNISEQPVVIQTVISSCGCTKPEWTKNPIMPGETGKIDVTYLNDQGAYPFDKSLTVYITGEPKPIILRMKGVVHEKLKSLKELFPENFNALSFRKSFIDFGNISKDNNYTMTIEAANTSNRSIEVAFTNLAKGLSVHPNPVTIPAGQKKELLFTIDAVNSNGWGKTYYSNTISVNGNRVSDRELKIFASLRDNFSNLSKEDKDNAPLPMAGSSSYDFGKIKKGAKVNTNFRIRNLGRRDLLIHKVETEFSHISSKYPAKIRPGDTGIIEIEVNTSQEIGEKTYILTIISNSPSRPVMNLIITGNIIQ